MTINSVTGSVAIAELGKTLLHEHIFIAMPGAQYDPWYPFDRTEVLRQITEKLNALHTYGVQTILDPAPIELGRDPLLLREVSEKTGITILCTTGFYYEAVGLPAYWRNQPIESIAELFIREIEVGIGNTGIKAAALKCGTGDGSISPNEAKFLEAVCIAHKATGVPILTHTQAGTCGPEQIVFFQAHGVDMAKVIIGHSCGNPNPDYHDKILQSGAFIGFDRVSYDYMLPDVVRAENAARIIAIGCIDQLVLSQDIPLYWLGRFPLDLRHSPAVQKHRVLVDDGETWSKHPTYLFETFFPQLKALGVTDAQLDHILINTPRKLFS